MVNGGSRQRSERVLVPGLHVVFHHVDATPAKKEVGELPCVHSGVQTGTTTDPDVCVHQWIPEAAAVVATLGDTDAVHLRCLGLGKVLAGAVYVHADALPLLPEPLREAVVRVATLREAFGLAREALVVAVIRPPTDSASRTWQPCGDGAMAGREEALRATSAVAAA